MDKNNYKAAYERQKIARARAENQLENISRELYGSNKALQKSYEKLKNQKSQLLHQEKLASIGQLSAGIAHEINNPSGFIKSNLTTLEHYTADIFQVMAAYQSFVEKIEADINNAQHENLKDDLRDSLRETLMNSLTEIRIAEKKADIEYLLEDIPNLINESIDGANRITKIVDGLKVFSRIDSDYKEILDVNETIENTLKLVQNEIKYTAELSIDYGELPKTMGYPGSLSQVILNILVNASQAVEENGRINLSTTLEKNWILISIKDNGVGISEDAINKIFDPFFTTKPVGLGTGLGLSISSGIMKQHGGQIEVDSKVGKGTLFTLHIPVVDISPI
ncbi:PAS/PAC sensor signal transduction histidine kinase [gamma proteobacterium IMCC1989]|jgi:two-component system, NtrC family, sensor kinase|nr:PAS/PAC sensor signal transduction histidine kinase [gamma proteobacterium IMCC1989]